MKMVQQLERLVATLGWEHISGKTDNSFIRSNYIWLALVPAAAKVLQNVQDEVVISLGESQIDLVMELPFSWHLFYWGAVSFVLAHLLYIWQCPPYTRRFHDIEVYRRLGLWPEAIFNVYKKGADKSDRIDKLIEEGSSGLTPGPRLLNIEAEVFNFLLSKENKKKPIARWFCTWFLHIGYILFSIVFMQNLIFVGSMVVTD